MSAFEDKMKGKCNVIKGKLKQKYADLTEDDLEYTEGQEDELVGLIQQKTGEAKDSIKKFINQL